MRYNDVIYLISKKYETDFVGNQIATDTTKMVFANKYQVSSSEFYSDNLRHEGAQSTIRNKTSFQIRSASYSGEQQYKYKNTIYDIVRVSDNGEFVLIVGVETIGKG